MQRCFPALMAIAALPFALLMGAGNSGRATTGAPLRTDVPMALDGRLLVETAHQDRRMVREAADARSGDRLIFLIRYRNNGAASLPGYDFVAPVPKGVHILPDRMESVRVSADGGRNWVRPDSPLRINAQGKLRPANDMGVTHVRLRLARAIAPGESGTVAYRGVLL